jgi:diaminopropionate ammonia-lyase
MRAVINPALDTDTVPAPSDDAAAFHRALSGYAPTPVHQLDAIASELGVAAVQVKDESTRLGLPAFKILGASWAVERALRDEPAVHTLVAASAGNHGRAVARVAAMRGLACRVFLPERSLAVRREAIAAEGAEVVVVDGTYEDAVETAAPFLPSGPTPTAAANTTIPSMWVSRPHLARSCWSPKRRFGSRFP